MSKIIGIRREDKNEWEKRVPLVPKHLKELKKQHDIDVVIQPSSIRIFPDEEYIKNGAMVKEDLSKCPVVFAVKEIPMDFFKKGKTYVFFAHVIKGQKHNMPMLKKMMNLKCTLIDYEKIADEQGRRLVFFGRYAGIAGMVDSLWAFGQRMRSLGNITPFNEIKQATNYHDINEIKSHLEKISNAIKQWGIPNSISPMVVGFAGYGHVSKGAQEILDILPIEEINPQDINFIHQNPSNNVVYKVVFREKDMVEPISKDINFDLQDYYSNPHKYRSVFNQYVPHLSILMNCIYWSDCYPRLITKKDIKEAFTGEMKLQVIGDISVDVNGAIEFTEKVTNPGRPVFVYNPLKDEIIDDYDSKGVVVMAVDNLPCEIPRESSKAFSQTLLEFIPPIANSDFSKNFDSLDIPSEIKKAIILHNGKLTPDYEYINKFL